MWLDFADGQLGANAGCNTLSGSYTLDGSTIVIEQMAGTEMACEPALMEQDAWLTEFLTSRPSYTLEAETLIVTAGGTSITLTDREVFNPDRPLEERGGPSTRCTPAAMRPAPRRASLRTPKPSSNSTAPL